MRNWWGYKSPWRVGTLGLGVGKRPYWQNCAYTPNWVRDEVCVDLNRSGVGYVGLRSRRGCVLGWRDLSARGNERGGRGRLRGCVRGSFGSLNYELIWNLHEAHVLVLHQEYSTLSERNPNVQNCDIYIN